MHVRIHCHGDVSDRRTEEIIRRVEAAGLLTSTEPRVPTPVALVLCGVVDHSVAEVIRDLRRERCALILVVAMPGLDVPSALSWQVLHYGASEILPWDRTPDPVGQIVVRLTRWAEVEALLERPLVREHLVGESAAWLGVLRQVVEVSVYTNASVLLIGESGTGKELIARLIHTLDARPRKSELVLLDCSAVVPELSGSEFFGHERGAFTGAVLTREGAFALAKGGTLFLDEVGELPPALQSQLLRVIQERTFKPVGSNTWRNAEFRLVCATNRDLMTDVDQGRFRADLYYRLATWVFRLPPLSERTEDIIPLARHFLREFTPDRRPLEIDEAVREHLQTRHYRGNVRELRQIVSRMAQRHVGGGPITVGDLPEDDRPSRRWEQEDWQDEQFDRAVRRALTLGAGLRDISQAAADAAIDIAVSEEGGNLQRAARRLRVTDRALQLRRAHRRAT